MKPMKISIDNWENVVVEVRRHSGKPDLPYWSALVNYYRICVPSLVTDLSRTLWNLYQRIGGTKNETYSSYYDLPAFWVNACEVIDMEINRIDKVRADKTSRDQRELIRQLKGKKYGNK